MQVAVPPEPEASEPKFQDGFTPRVFLGALLIALIMIPGAIVLGMSAGWGIGEAAEWVTIVLFAEVARRSFQPLRKQEIYVLFYIAASLTTALNAQRGLSGGPFSMLVWNAYFTATKAAAPIAQSIPSWASPSAEHAAVLERTLWHPAWWTPIALLVATDLCGRLNWMSLGYALFRVTSDVEKLPFPMASVAASGATALAEAGSETWRWRVFTTGTLVGVLFGAIYLAVPTLSAAVLGKPIQIIPIPFADFSAAVQPWLPAAVVGLSLSLGNVLVGFVLPFEIVLGATLSSVLAMIVANPILFHAGMLPSYRPGGNALLTKLAVDMDFWLSVGIGVNVAIAVIGIGLMSRAFIDAKRKRKKTEWTFPTPAGRGDMKLFWAIGIWIASTMTLVILCRVLVPNFPVWIILVFGFLWTPINSYISARMHGLTGRGVGIPYMREATIVGSGYTGVDIWYAPVPLNDHGWAAQRFREVELTGTKFSSIWKAELLLFPILIVASFGFWAYFWHQSPLPNSAYPYAQKVWPVEASLQSAMQQINQPGSEGNWIRNAIKPQLIGAGAAGGLLAYSALSLVKAPLLFFYGFAGGIGLMPIYTIPQLIGAWIGRKHMARRYGEDRWREIAPIVLAGFSCGSGLIAMLSIAISLLVRATS